MRGRAFRRRQSALARRRARQLLLRLWDFRPSWITPRAVGRRAATRVTCSCWMCGNPRRYSGEPTRQERRADDHLDHDPDLAAYPLLR